jgi:hypothetical protein
MHKLFSAAELTVVNSWTYFKKVSIKLNKNVNRKNGNVTVVCDNCKKEDEENSCRNDEVAAKDVANWKLITLPKGG